MADEKTVGKTMKYRIIIDENAEEEIVAAGPVNVGWDTVPSGV